MKTRKTMKARRLTELTRAEYAELASLGGEDGMPLATILLPMERKGAETRKNPIVFKNALAEAQAEWERFGDGNGRLQASLKDLEALAAPTEDFWQHQEAGLAMVIGGKEPPAAYQTPFAMGPLTYLGRRPFLSPLLRLLNGTNYYVLVLDLDRIRLLRAGRWTVEEIELEGIPLGLEEAMRFDDPERSLQFRTVASSNLPGPGGGGVVAFHGQGVTGDETRKKKAQRFFEMVDKGLARNFGDREAPLLLLGPDDEVGLYREVNHYPHLCEADLRFNASNLSRDGIEEMICGWIDERESDAKRSKVKELHSALGQGRAAQEEAEVLKACVDGRVASLFVKENEYRYGVVDRAGDRVEIREVRQAGDEELLNMAASSVATTGGEVWFVDESESLGSDSPVAAILRY